MRKLKQLKKLVHSHSACKGHSWASGSGIMTSKPWTTLLNLPRPWAFKHRDYMIQIWYPAWLPAEMRHLKMLNKWMDEWVNFYIFWTQTQTLGTTSMQDLSTLVKIKPSICPRRESFILESLPLDIRDGVLAIYWHVTNIPESATENNNKYHIAQFLCCTSGSQKQLSWGILAQGPACVVVRRSVLAAAT